ncbi:MAG: hypothetical protein AB1757_10450 [Acidobacteriota bacterium]
MRSKVAIILFGLVFSVLGISTLQSYGQTVAPDSSLIILPAGTVNVAPNQPAVSPDSTRGIINALCDVKLNIVSCPFFPNGGFISCDSNGDGIEDFTIALKDINHVNSLLTQVTIPALSPQLPGTAFPFACCGGVVSLTLVKKVNASDDNIFGDYTQKTTCPIDVGIRAPVVVSATPSGGDCAIEQNIQIPGSCFSLPFVASTDSAGEVSYSTGTTINVTDVYAVEVGNPGNIIQAKRFVVLTPNLIDGLFAFGNANAGKKFLIYVTGPNGTSRNLTSLPPGTPANCPLGNEQGVQVTFTCGNTQTTPGEGDSAPPVAIINQCRLERSETGALSLIIKGIRFQANAQITVGGVSPKKLKFKDPDTVVGGFSTIIAKGRMCNGLPGAIVIVNPGETPSQPFFCNQSCNF